MEAISKDSKRDVPVPLTPGQRCGFWLITLPAVVVPFVSLAPMTSPVRALWEALRFWKAGAGLGSHLLFVFLAAPFLLGPLIVLVQLRLWISPTLARSGRGFMVAVAAGSGGMTMLFVVLGIVTMVRTGVFSDVRWIATAMVALVGAALGWTYWRREKAVSGARSFAALLVAYVANAVICLVGFFEGRQEIGWWLALVATSGMLLELFVLARQSRHAAGCEDAEPVAARSDHR